MHSRGRCLFGRRHQEIVERMVRAEKLLERMRRNPRDWRIEDVVTVCTAFGIACTAPRKGSHYKVKHDRQAEVLTVPARRPIKPVYIMALVRFIEAAVVKGVE